MKIKLDRIISIATLGASVAAIFLVMRKPAPVAPPMPPAAVAANAQSFQEKIEQLEQAKAQGHSNTTVHQTASEAPAANTAAAGAPEQSASPAGSASRQDGTFSGDLGPGQPEIKDYQMSFEGDLVKGQFLTKVAGKDVWVTVTGRLGSKDGYATFEPTEFKVG